MSETLAGRRALVTASSQGLGRAIALRLAQGGCAVAMNARTATTLTEAADGIAAATGRGPIPLVADLAVAAQAAALVPDAAARLGGLDILVVNSGHIPYGTLEDLPDEAWYGASELLLMSAVRLTRAAVPLLREAGGGSIVFVGSSTVRRPPAHLLLSSVFRLGIAGLAKTLARSLAADNIRVNVVAPGYFATGRVHRRLAEHRAAGVAESDARRIIAGDIPMGRVGEPEELAELVAFLVGGGAPFLSGTHINLDGAADEFPL